MTYLQSYQFAGLGLAAPELEALSEIQDFNANAEKHLGASMQFPEPGLVLDLAARLGNEAREFNYLHQMSLLHATHFEMANKVKTTYLIDCNPIGIYAAARSLLELHAMLHFVTESLREAGSGAEADWRNRGIRFFQAIVKARFGTTDPQIQKLLREEGLDDAATQPLRLAKARKLLAAELPWLEEQYATLCDYVHHNLLSQRVAGAIAGEAPIARSSSGGQLILTEAAPIIQYEFPMSEPGRHAVAKTAARALISLKGLVAALNAMPRTPFSDAELVSWTGSTIGLRSPKRPRTQPVRRKRPGRNEPCPCGSGKKFKICHGA